ncbi:MAG: hypothetical protein ABSH08_08740 [Tepidisphaeraceae bacterium]|jgi:hypothetical protein
MTLLRFTLACACGLGLVVGCAKTDDGQPQAQGGASTQPAVAGNPGQTSPNTGITAPEPTASMLKIDQSPQWFPPARLRLSAKDGKVIAHLYSDDRPKGAFTREEPVNSYDILMVLPDISDPADLARTTWVNHSSSMERQDTPYGIFLSKNKQQDILQPMDDVRVSFSGQAPRIKVKVQGTFALFHVSDQTPHPAPAPVSVFGILDATVK